MSWLSRKSSLHWTWPYTPDERDRVVLLADAPQSDAGAPLPVVLASDFRLLLVYLLQQYPRDWDGTPRVVGADTDDLPVAIVEFQQPYAHIFGPPNDEAIAGHPLCTRGLRTYGAYIVEESSWIRSLERMNSIHPYHKPGRFQLLRHYAFSFHESTFECAANDHTVSVERGSLSAVVARAAARL
jgi:hypothetical protein